MTEPEGDSQAISVAELLARNGQRVGAGGGGRRRRGVKGGISVAELTGEFQAVRDTTSETPESATETPDTEAPAAETPTEAATPETPVVESSGVTEPEPKKPEPKKPEPKPEPVAAKEAKDEPAPKPDADATAAFSLADADAADKDAAPADEADEAADKADDAPTLIAPAVAADDRKNDRKADDHKFDSGWRSAATTVLEPVPAQSLAHSVEPEPRLLSGQSVAGDLLRRDGDVALGQDDVAVAESDLDDESPAAPEDLPDEPSAAKQWAVLLGQGAVAVVAGALMFKGFEKLWDMLPMVALILAVLVIVGLVAMVRILRRTDDITSLVIAVVAGVFVTLGPLAFLLSTS